MPSLRLALRVVTLSLLAMSSAAPAWAGGGPLGIDTQVAYDNGGIWKRSKQNFLVNGLIGGVLLGALAEGGEDRLGRTFWQGVDAGILSGAAEIGLKYVFGRERPSQTNDPNRWFTHGQSFPSGEVTTVSSLVTPFVLEYGRDHPAVYALELLPAYDAIARVKTRGHWRSDVIAGFALGTGTAYLLRRRTTPFFLSLMPRGVQVGVIKRF